MKAMALVGGEFAELVRHLYKFWIPGRKYKARMQQAIENRFAVRTICPGGFFASSMLGSFCLERYAYWKILKGHNLRSHSYLDWNPPKYKSPRTYRSNQFIVSIGKFCITSNSSPNMHFSKKVASVKLNLHIYSFSRYVVTCLDPLITSELVPHLPAH
jgi:hypothetical protein